MVRDRLYPGFNQRVNRKFQGPRHQLPFKRNGKESALMGVDYSSVSVGRKRFQLLVERNKEVLRLKEKVQREISQE